MMKCRGRDKTTAATFACDLEPGHEGDHMAFGVDSSVAWMWNDSDTAD